MSVKQSNDDLRSQLKDQIDFLKSSAKDYDDGRINEAKRIAISIRVLVHDTEESQSLLMQLNKKNIVFYDTATKPIPGNLISTPILVYLYCCGAEPTRYLPRLTNSRAQKVNFDQWWNGIAIDDSRGNVLTRKTLILKMCNQDGGAHVSPKLHSGYAAISKLNSVGWKYVSPDGNEQDIMGVEKASVRQIGYEILKSLEDEFTEYF
jgi:hypothetical protein